ncbi:hypothetical protein Loshitsa2_00051 [Erwinia phage Loshitsa2]|uniref:Spanin n=2 Tax=Micantvirus TaxID=3424950 RepID=A0AAE9JVQ2_9CAUD|nr:hypothetical protein Micant_00051 [Erwinia phage Micant]UNA01126.1 hypothetical protein Loshitsa2_00051 [Erwinia phage Loshitsa2]
MKRALALLLVLCLSGCSATSALTAATGLIGNKPDLTAQVGAENTKQGIGLSGKSDSSSETTVKDSTVGSVDSSRSKAAKAQNISTGSITADRIEVRNSDSTALILAFLAGLLPVVAGEVLLRYITRKKTRQEASQDA